MEKAEFRRNEVDASSPAGTSSQVGSPMIESANLEKSGAGTSAIRKLNWKVAPFCATITILAYIDRGNLGFAASKICNELSFSHSEYGLGASLFFVGYVFSQIPSNLLLKRCGAIRWLALLLIIWGITASSLAFVQNAAQFYLLRLLLGFAEGGCFPGVWYYISTFFPSRYIAFPLALIEASIQLASPVSAPLAAGLLALDGLFGVDGWRLLFFAEGIVPVLFGLSLCWLLPASPETATFLDDEEKAWLELEIKQNQHPVTSSFSEQLKTVLGKAAFWGVSSYHFLRFILLNTGLYWTTLIIDDMLHGDDDDDDDDTCASSKSTGVTAVLLTTVPFTMCAILCIYIGHISPHMTNRPVKSGIIGASGSVFWVLWVLSRHHAFVVALLALGLGISCTMTIMPIALGLLTSHFDHDTNATALATANTIGSFGGILGPIVVGHLVDTQGYGVAAIFLAAVAFVSGVVLTTVDDPLSETTPEEQHPWELLET